MNNKVKNLEAVVKNGYLARTEYSVKKDWRERVLFDIQQPEKKLFRDTQSILQPGNFWRLATASVITALIICLVMYLLSPMNNLDEDNISYLALDNYDSYMEIVSR